MKLRLLPLSILLVASMAACQKSGPSASVTPNPNAPDPKDSTVKIADNKWNWNGYEPFSYKLDGKQVRSGQLFSFYKATVSNGVPTTVLHSRIDTGTTSKDDTLMFLYLPNKIKDMRVGDEYNFPLPTSAGAQLFAYDQNPFDLDIQTRFYFHPLEGGNLRVKITNITAAEIEGKFYGVLKQRSDIKSSSGVGWVKIEEGYFRYSLKDTTFGPTP
jgi:hypothetical protein